MTEDQIERYVERAMDRLDAQLMSGKLTQTAYDFEVKRLDDWSKRQWGCRTKN
jgi:hypothetical protein